MSVDSIRRAWSAAEEASEIEARLVAIGDGDDGAVRPIRGRTPASWSGRLRFEQALAGELGTEADAIDLQWLAVRAPQKAPPAERARARLGLSSEPSGPSEVRSRKGAPASERVRKDAHQGVPGVKQVLAVASGKGGVGKSTVAVNLALALQARGLRTGLLDADVYGPSVPTMLGSFEAPTREDGIFRPPTARDLPFLSLGLMVNPDQSVIWRGPMVQRMVRDMLQGTDWPDLDVLVVDLPPGTGDVQLTLVQRALLTGAVIVTTPQDIALIDTVRGLEMFRKMGVPVLGIIENMASWACPSCGDASHPFGQEGGEREAERLDVPFLGRVPLESAVRIAGDEGLPIVHRDPDSASSTAFTALAGRIHEALVGL